jgi:succinate-acetate transporter protein
MAVGNTFGATALTSYGGFWIGLGIIFTPGGFEIASAYGGATTSFYTAVGFYLYVCSPLPPAFTPTNASPPQGWFIFTFILWLLTLRSTVAFSSLFLTVWLTFLMLATGYMYTTTVNGVTTPNHSLNLAGGAFGIVAAFIAWWNMLAGIADRGNTFFLVPVLHFPWSEKGRQRRKEKAESIRDVEKGD